MLDRQYLYLCHAVVMQQEKSSLSDMYEHVRDADGEYDAQTMDAATESQRQMMQMTELDNTNDDDDDNDADKPDVPPDTENDIIQVISVYKRSCFNHLKLRTALFFMRTFILHYIVMTVDISFIFIGNITVSKTLYLFCSLHSV